MKERIFLNVLWSVDSSGKNIEKEFFNLKFEQYAKLLLDIQEEGLIKGVEALHADDTICELNIENINITLEGIEYLKKMDEEIQKNILEILHENRLKKSLTNGQIKKEVFTHLKHNEIEAHLNLLKDKGYIKEEKIRIPAFKSHVNKSFNTPASTQKKYRISPDGIEYVENNFKKKEKEYATGTIFNINGGVVNFGTIHNLNINYTEELKSIITEPTVREEIEKYFEEIKAVTAVENINKGKLNSIFKKIGEKAVEKGLDTVTDKLLDVGWVYAMSQIMQLVK